MIADRHAARARQRVAVAVPGLIAAALLVTGVFLSDRPFTIRFGTNDRAASVQLDL